MGGQAVCRRLGARPLYIGDRRAANPATGDADADTFANVVTLSRRREPLTTHHHPLDDGANNSPAEFDAAVDTTRALVRADGPLLVHCAAGISRSATVLATAIAAEDGCAFTEGLTVVQRHRERACPHPALREQAQRYLDGTHEPVATDPGRRRDRDIQQRVGDDPADDAENGTDADDRRRRGRAEAILDRFFGR